MSPNPNITPQSDPDIRSRARAFFLEIGLLVIFVILVPVVVLLDSSVVGKRLTDAGLTETLQVLLVALAALLCGVSIRALPQARGHLLLLTTAFTWMTVRENDSVLDSVVHGFWVYPATVVLFGGAWLVYRNRDTLLPGMLRHADTRPGAMMILGLILLIFFSRLFGTGALWDDVAGEARTHEVKSMVQEGIELLAYVFIAFGAVLSWRHRFGQGAG